MLFKGNLWLLDVYFDVIFVAVIFCNKVKCIFCLNLYLISPIYLSEDNILVVL